MSAGEDQNEVVVEDTQGVVAVDTARWEDLLRRAMGLLGIEGMTASLYFVDEAEIAGLKGDHLDGDGSPTDVLAFPIDEPVHGRGDGVAADLAGPRILGDIVICPSVAAAQAPGHAGSVDDEVALLVVHALLHLVGHDHVTGAERDAMHSEERRLLDALHGPLAADPWRADLHGGPDS